jgi:hypothetical protein
MFPFTFASKLRAPAYALAAIPIFLSQHALVFAVFRWLGRTPPLDFWFAVLPLRTLATLDRASTLVMVLAIAFMLAVALALASLSFRRASDADIDEWIAAYAIAPIVQLPVILALCVWPSRTRAEPPAEAGDLAAAHPARIAVTFGVVAGMALTLFAVAVGALFFRTYGFGMFVISPFVIGAMTGYFGNRAGDLGVWRTSRLVMGAALLGGIALIAFALEGVVCLVLVAPLGFAVALLGGLMGRAVALYTRRSPRSTLSAAALLPLVFALESVLATTISFDTVESIDIDAPPAVVWSSIVQMEPITEAPGLPFRLGVAYPLGGRIVGEGVGALRYGEFSTGTATERVTEWVPERKLAFVVVEDMPAMRELSPYRHVHTPHLQGYFRTTLTSFEIVPRADGGSAIIERTSHELKLEPAVYWLPLARFVVHANNARVLEHIRRAAEARARGVALRAAIIVER